MVYFKMQMFERNESLILKYSQSFDDKLRKAASNQIHNIPKAKLEPSLYTSVEKEQY